MINCKKEKSSRAVDFCSVGIGDTFIYRDILYMKVGTFMRSAVELSTGVLNDGFRDDDLVVPVDCELTYTIR